MPRRPLISIVTCCYNEEGNVRSLFYEVREQFKQLPEYDFEHIFIDNASEDATVQILKEVAAEDSRCKIIVNARNFGVVRSGNHGFVQAYGDAVINLAADFQDPPELIPQLVRQWATGSAIVICCKNKSHEKPLMFLVRKLYYALIRRIADVEHIDNFTGFGLFDRKFVDLVREVDDTYLYFRGLVAEFGYDIARIEYVQPVRRWGRSSTNFYRLYEEAMSGLVNHTKLPIRLAGLMGFVISIFSLIVAFGYLIYKLLFWDSFSLGVAPLVIGLFFFSAVQLFFISVIGEYVGSVLTQVKHRPRVFERERVNFVPPPAPPEQQRP